MPEKKRLVKRRYIGFEISNQYFEQVEQRAGKLGLKVSAYTRMILLKELTA